MTDWEKLVLGEAIVVAVVAAWRIIRWWRRRARRKPHLRIRFKE